MQKISELQASMTVLYKQKVWYPYTGVWAWHVIQLLGSFLKSEIYGLGFKIPRFQYMNII